MRSFTHAPALEFRKLCACAFRAQLHPGAHDPKTCWSNRLAQTLGEGCWVSVLLSKLHWHTFRERSTARLQNITPMYIAGVKKKE